MAGSRAALLSAMTSCTSLAEARAWAWAAACSTLARVAARPSCVNFSRLASDRRAKMENWSMAASLAALNWSILIMAMSCRRGWGAALLLHCTTTILGRHPAKSIARIDFFVAPQHILLQRNKINDLRIWRDPSGFARQSKKGVRPLFWSQNLGKGV